MDLRNYISSVDQPSFSRRASGGGISIVPVTTYRYFRLRFPGTQSGFVRVQRFQLFETLLSATNLANGATTTDTTHYSGSETFAQACDNSEGTQWAFNNGVDAIGHVDLGAEYEIALISLGINTYPSAGRFVVEGSKDDSNWDIIYDTQNWYGFANPGWNSQNRYIAHANYIYEVVFTGTQSAGFRDIGYMDLLDKNGASILEAAPNHIKHFDFNNAYAMAPGGEYWANVADPDLSLRGTFNINTDDLRIVMKSPNRKAEQVSLSRATAGGNAMPNAFSVRVSQDNGYTWQTINTTSGLSWSVGETKNFLLDAH